MSDFERDLINPFGGDNPSVDEVDEALYGKVNIPASGRKVATPIPVLNIVPDPIQPRRAIPLQIRGDWDGQPNQDALDDMLIRWQAHASKVLGVKLMPLSMIDGKQEIDVPDDVDGVTKEFIDLMALAASIYRDGLLNPISIIRRGDAGKIVAGERRWLAHVILYSLDVDNGKFAKIPVFAVEQDVWKQAAENGARRPLNAIGMARQLALLVMDMYKGDAGEKFDVFAALVNPGGVDRPFYAQVADGTLYQVKRGYMARILDVTGLKSKGQVGHYRALLRVPDRIWWEADVENWTEGAIRPYVPTTPRPPQKTEKSGLRSTTVDLSGENGGNLSQNNATDKENLTVGVASPPQPSPLRREGANDGEPMLVRSHLPAGSPAETYPPSDSTHLWGIDTDLHTPSEKVASVTRYASDAGLVDVLNGLIYLAEVLDREHDIAPMLEGLREIDSIEINNIRDNEWQAGYLKSLVRTRELVRNLVFDNLVDVVVPQVEQFIGDLIVLVKDESDVGGV